MKHKKKKEYTYRLCEVLRTRPLLHSGHCVANGKKQVDRVQSNPAS